jgi:ribosomal protein S18 acetylase RimI-like enzyme
MVTSMMSQSQSLVVRQPQSHERMAVLELAWQVVPPELRWGDRVQNRRERRRGERLFGAWRGNVLVGGVWGKVYAGRAAVARMPRLVAGEPHETQLTLLARLEDFFVQSQASFYQIQLERSWPYAESWLTKAGLQCAGDLVFLACDRLNTSTLHDLSLRFETYNPNQRMRLAATIERTYVGTLDLPALDGLRSIQDVIDGYLETGRHHPDGWRFVLHNDEDVGCLLLTEHPPHRAWEIIYMGIVPECRGRGWGLHITRYAKQLVREAGGQRLLLAVDTANTPARTMYAQAGFDALESRTIFLKSLNERR